MKNTPVRDRTLLRLSRKFTQNRDSSVKSTVHHWFIVHLLCFMAHCRLASLCALERDNLTAGLLALKLTSWSHLLSVWVDTRTSSGSSRSFCRLTAGMKWFLRACRFKYRSWFGVVTGYLPPPCFLLTLPDLLNLFQTLEMTLRRPHCVCNFTLNQASLQLTNGPVEAKSCFLILSEACRALNDEQLPITDNCDRSIGNLMTNNHVWRPSKAIKDDISLMTTLTNNTSMICINCEKHILVLEQPMKGLDPLQMLTSVCSIH